MSAHDHSNLPAAVAASVLLHASIVALLAARPPRFLVPQAGPLRVTLVEAGAQTEGPGSRSPELRLARRPAAVPPTPSPQPPARAESAPAPDVAAVPPAPTPSPAPPAKSPPVEPVRRPPAAAAPAGDSAASAPAQPAAGGSGLGTDVADSAPSWAPVARIRYEELLFAWMDRHKRYPLLAQRRRLQGVALVRVRIDREGRVLARSVERSSGEPMLDEASLEMVRRANPFPKPPADYAGSSFEFVAPIEYRLRGPHGG